MGLTWTKDEVTAELGDVPLLAHESGILQWTILRKIWE